MLPGLNFYLRLRQSIQILILLVLKMKFFVVDSITLAAGQGLLCELSLLVWICKHHAQLLGGNIFVHESCID
jgi:hypothetical protein